MKRYQECNILEKAWRRRWYILIPFETLQKYLARTKIYLDLEVNKKLQHTDIFEYSSFTMCWRLAIGMAQSRMKWYYTTEEVFENIKSKFKDKRNKKDE